MGKCNKQLNIMKLTLYDNELTFQTGSASPPSLPPPGPPGWDSSRILSVSLYTHLHPQLDLSSLPPSPQLYSALLPAARLFIGPVSFPHLQGGRVVTVGPQSLSGILHGNENAPCWCRNLFLSLPPRGLAWYCFVVDVPCSMWCKDNEWKGICVNKIPLWGVWGILGWIALFE